MAELPRRKTGKKNVSNGFSLIELIIVIGIISILAATGIPMMLRHRISANEVAAAGALKTIAASAVGFFNSAQPHRFPENIKELGATTPPLIDAGLARGIKYGYYFSFASETMDGAGRNYVWSAEAHPIVYRRQGIRSFYVDVTGIMLGQDILGDPGHGNMRQYGQ